MPKVKTNLSLKKIMLEFGKDIFSTDRLILYYKLGKIKVPSEKNIMRKVQHDVWEENMHKLLKF